MINREIRIGTSGWVYKHWRGVFYPPELPQREWFSYFAAKFDTVEINNSFYRLPSAEAFTAWRKQAPRGFVYAVKASRFLTHMKKLKEPEKPIESFFERANHLGEKLGPILYQFPPHWRVNLQRFEHFLEALPKRYRHVIEFRDESWLIDEVFRLMERHDIAHCIHDMRTLEIPVRVTTPPAYLRFHGTVKYGGDYQRAQLKAWAKRIEGWHNEKIDVFAYFNNDVGGYALENVSMLKKLIGGERK